mmetsp:Transcript_77966/g.215565  ORF Transcript_77966/g.215565 Transcript_77966/m.215565 type:complete len:310 (+) Transcript_77966:155-1084(+)
MRLVSFFTAVSYAGSKGLRSFARMLRRRPSAFSTSGSMFMRLGAMAATANASGTFPFVSSGPATWLKMSAKAGMFSLRSSWVARRTNLAGSGWPPLFLARAAVSCRKFWTASGTPSCTASLSSSSCPRSGSRALCCPTRGPTYSRSSATALGSARCRLACARRPSTSEAPTAPLPSRAGPRCWMSCETAGSPPSWSLTFARRALRCPSTAAISCWWCSEVLLTTPAMYSKASEKAGGMPSCPAAAANMRWYFAPSVAGFRVACCRLMSAIVRRKSLTADGAPYWLRTGTCSSMARTKSSSALPAATACE